MADIKFSALGNMATLSGTEQFVGLQGAGAAKLGTAAQMKTFANTPGGSDTQVQFNDGGAFGGDAGLTYDKTDKILRVTTPEIHPNGQIFAESASTSSATLNGTAVIGGRFQHNGTGTLNDIWSLSFTQYNNSTGRITRGVALDLYIENISTGTYGVMCGARAQLYNDDSATVDLMVGFDTKKVANGDLNGNYGAGTITEYIAFRGASVNNSGTYGALYGLKLDSQVGLTVSGNNHAINYNNTFIVDSAGQVTAPKFIPASVPTITGSRGGNAALADLLTKLATLGLIIDGTS